MYSITGVGSSHATAGAGGTYSVKSGGTTGDRQTYQTFRSRGSKARLLVRRGPRERTVEQSGEWHTERPS